MYTLLLAVSLLLLTAANVNAQVTISKLYSEGTNKTDPTDWVEILNLADSAYNLNGHRLEDTADSDPIVMEWNSDMLIQSNSACLFFVGNRLNKAGDTLYLKSGESEIDCVAYGDANGGVCGKTISPSSANEHSASVCVPSTPEPTVSPQTPEPTAEPPKHTSSPTSTIKPTATPQVLAHIDQNETATPASTSTPTLAKAVFVEKVQTQDEPIDLDEDTQNQIGRILLIIGTLTICLPVAHLMYAEYNKKYFDNQTFN